jgi:hypothetical protein
MPLPAKVLPGFSASLFAQSGATPTVLTNTQLATLANVSGIAINANQVLVETVPAFGQDDAVANFTVAGSRQSDKIPTQSAPTSMTITAAWNPSDTVLIQIRTDAYNGTIDRTYVVQATDGTGTIYYAFNARASEWQIDAQPGAEAKAVFTLHPRSGQYGWSNTA